MCLLTRTRLPWFKTKAACMCKNSPSAPGSAMDMLRRSLRSAHYLCRDTCLWPRTESNMSCSRSCLWGGSPMVPQTESTSQPSKTFCTTHAPSLLASFLMEAGSCREGGSEGLSRQNKESSDSRSARLTRFCFYRGPCTRPRKLSTNMSIYARGWRWSQTWLWCMSTSTGGAGYSGAGELATLLR